MRVLVLAPYPFDTAPGQRFRIEQWMPHLERQGVEFHFEAFMSPELRGVLNTPGHTLQKMRFILADLGRRIARVARARRFDVVFLHREAALVGPPIVEYIIRTLGVPVVFEFDDAIYVPYMSPANRYFTLLKFQAWKADATCRLATHVIVGNDVLREYAMKRNPHVTVVPTTIDTDKYTDEYDASHSGRLVIGWSGSYSSIQYLDFLKPVFTKLAEKYDFRVEVIGATTFKMDGVDVTSQDWCACTEVEDLRRIDIGVMPLPDESWALGKCALKALQYMALGIPTVVSPVGANAEVIRHGVDGLHASTVDEWVAQLERLLESAELRTQLGGAGRARVVEHYSAEVHAPRVFEVLRKAAASAGRVDARSAHRTGLSG